MKKRLLLLFVGWLVCSFGVGQNPVTGKLTLEEAIKIAHARSPQAQMVQLSFMSQYWSFRSYKAQLLPSLNLSGNLGNYNRSLVDVRDPETGRISYVANNTLSNDLSVYINQKIALTGGNVSLNTSLARLDQFSYDTKTYNSNPVTINYTQPLRSFNTLKWQRKSEENLRDTRGMYKIAQQRHDIGTVTKSELLQLELSMMNAELTVSNSKVDLEVALFNFKSYLGVVESTFFELQPPMNVPEVFMEYDFVLNKALQNSSHNVSLKIKELNSRKSVAQAKADRGIQVELRANLGFSQTGDDLQGVYSRLKDREVVGLSLSMPIYDWGMSRGRVKMAEAEARLARTELEQEETKFQQDIRIKVMQFNNQARQCNISAKALQVAEERYDITKKRFQNGGITVTDLNTAQKELDSASEQYINQLRTFWNAYFELRKLSLYDFISKRDISAEFDKIVEK